LGALVLVSLLVAGWTVVSSPGAGSSTAPDAGSSTSRAPDGWPVESDRRRTERDWADVLRSLDRIRAEAWRRGDPAELVRVYAPGSPLLQEDQARLGAYTDRGLRVTGARTTYHVVGVVWARSDRVGLVVVDRLGRSRAVSSVSERSRALPRDDVARHVITLRRIDAGWRIGAVRPTDQ